LPNLEAIPVLALSVPRARLDDRKPISVRLELDRLCDLVVCGEEETAVSRHVIGVLLVRSRGYRASARVPARSVEKSVAAAAGREPTAHGEISREAGRDIPNLTGHVLGRAASSVEASDIPS
jgi:hypothetical protein